MQEIFERIKERLEENQEITFYFDGRPPKQVITYDDVIEIVNQVAEETNKGEISDGYHTFNELYHHRAILFSVICNSNKELAWKSRLHDTGDMYDGMFIVGIETPEGQATYHYDIEPYWDMFEVKKLQNAPKWDGHTPDEAIRRIGLLGKDINTSSNDGCIPLPKVAFDRMIARMESESERSYDEEESLFINVRDAARIVREIVKEHSDSENPNKSDDGWIPCSSGELPQNEGMYLTTVYDKATGRCLLKHRKFENGKFVEGGQSRAFPVIAWQQKPLPAPYQPKGEK